MKKVDGGPLSISKRLLADAKYKDLAKLKSIYLWGDPGCGKTFIMDQFYDSLPPSVGKRKLHYNEFMLEVHKEEHHLNQKLKNSSKDTIA